MRLLIDPTPFPVLAGYRIGLESETYAPDSKDLRCPTPTRRATRHSPSPCRARPDTTHALKASVTVGINDPSGHASLATTEIPVRPAGRLIGIKPAFSGNAVDAGTEAAFDVIAVAPDGTRAAMPAKLRLVRERPDWRLVMRGSLARYETVWRDEPLETTSIAIPADAPFHFAKHLDFGRYRIEVLEDGGMAATSMRFRAGWVSSDSPDVPDQVDVSADRSAYTPGETARIHIAPPFAGQATLLVLSDRVHSVRNLTVPVGWHGCRRAGAGGLGTWRLRRRACVPHRGRCPVASRARHRPDLGRRRSWRAQAAGRVRRAGQVSAPCAGGDPVCTPGPAPGSVWRRWTRASCG